MKIISAVAVAQLFLFATGSDAPGESKRVVCFYLGVTSEKHGALLPEDIDASVCSHLLFLAGSINNETEEIEIKPLQPYFTLGGEDFVQRLAKLKAVNPDIKLNMLVSVRDIEWVTDPSRRTNIITNSVKWLNESGFDGLAFPLYIDPRYRDKMADLLCEMKSEFDKYGYKLTSLINDRLFPEPTPGNESTISKLARCCDQVTLLAVDAYLRSTTYRSGSLEKIKPHVEWVIENGVPANKITFTVTIYGVYLILEDPMDTGLGAKQHGPANNYTELTGSNTIRYKELLRRMNDSSLGWTVRRDNTTEEPYAFSTTGLWSSYEDTTSMSFKARYVLEKGLLGMDIVPIDLDDDEGLEGKGRFALTRAVYNTFRGGNQYVDTSP